MPRPVRLELAWRRRPPRDGVPARDYLDFVVDGRSLEELLRPGDNIGVLGWGDHAAERASIELLMGRRTPPFASGRVPLFVCAACGELDCGAVAVRVERTYAGTKWSGVRLRKHAARRHPAAHPRPARPLPLRQTRVLRSAAPAAGTAHRPLIKPPRAFFARSRKRLGSILLTLNVPEFSISS
jgi:hypothetical protein